MGLVDPHCDSRWHIQWPSQGLKHLCRYKSTNLRDCCSNWLRITTFRSFSLLKKFDYRAGEIITTYLREDFHPSRRGIEAVVCERCFSRMKAT